MFPKYAGCYLFLFFLIVCEIPNEAFTSQRSANDDLSDDSSTANEFEKVNIKGGAASSGRNLEFTKVLNEIATLVEMPDGPRTIWLKLEKSNLAGNSSQGT